MLLLVLILVVIAFGLLVVALLSTSVLWAWVSVGVSVVAAVVLLVDWLQRRSAAKAGAMPATEQTTGAMAPMPAPDPGSARSAMAAPRGDLDPATEVLPIVPPSAGGASEPDSPTVMAAAPQQLDAQQTVVMPAVQPSGSPVRPSGADPAVTSSSANSSPNVTNVEDDRSAVDFGTGDQTVAVEPPSTPGATPSGSESQDDDEPAAPAGPNASGPPVEPPATGAPDAEAAGTGAAAPSDTPAKVGLGKAAAATSAAAAGAALTKPGAPAAETSGPEEPAPEAPTPAEGTAGPGAPEPAAATADPDAESTVAVGAHPGTPADGAAPDAPTHAPPADVAPVDATRGNAVTAPAEPVDLFAAPAAAPVEPASSAEAPEAPRDPIAAEIVSGLDDEVVVVDEQPRYHVSECRAVVSVAVIPLPVREAVELGFTPCGWCSPERTLAGRHQTASR